MEGKSRFTPRQINKALRLLRELPVKDGRKSMRETLRLLEQGMRDALEKGYSRGEIRQQIAEAEIIISATTLKGFLAGEQEDAGQNQDAAAVEVSKENSPRHDEKPASDSQKSSRKPDGNLAEKASPGSIIMACAWKTSTSVSTNMTAQRGTHVRLYPQLNHRMNFTGNTSKVGSVVKVPINTSPIDRVKLNSHPAA